MEKAEQYMRDCLSFDVQNEKVMLAYACLLVQLNRTAEATVMFKKLLANGYEQVKVQLLLSHAYKLQGDDLTSEKFKAQAWISKMREVGKVTEVGKSKEAVPKASTSMMKFQQAQQQQAQVTENQSQDGSSGNYEVPSQVAFDGQRLNSADQDAVYIELSKYLLDETLYVLAKDCLEYIEDKNTFDFLANCAKF